MDLQARAARGELLVILPGLPVEGLRVIRQQGMVNIEIVQYLLEVTQIFGERNPGMILRLSFLGPPSARASTMARTAS